MPPTTPIRSAPPAPAGEPWYYIAAEVLAWTGWALTAIGFTAALLITSGRFGVAPPATLGSLGLVLAAALALFGASLALVLVLLLIDIARSLRAVRRP